MTEAARVAVVRFMKNAQCAHKQWSEQDSIRELSCARWLRSQRRLLCS